jgi:hypothetical protein
MPDKKDDKKPGVKLQDLSPRKDAQGGGGRSLDGKTGADGKIRADGKTAADGKVQTDRFM